MPFSTLGLHSTLTRELAARNYFLPFPIQKEAIPAILEQRDVLGIAPTGSGKTVSFVLPILTNLQNSTSDSGRLPNVLVLVPTRELAIQVQGEFRLFGSILPAPIRSLAVFGGVSKNPQMIALRAVNIIVATPGRLIELVESNATQLTAINTLVLDEADKMLSLGFAEEMKRIFSLLPEKRQNLLFSATLNDDVTTINQFLLDDPLVIKVKQESDSVDLIEQVAYSVTPESKGPFLRYIIKENSPDQILIFASSVYKVDNVVRKLLANGIDALAIHGKKSQGARTEALAKFKSGKLRILVATDLLSRGIDIEFLPLVINYELPRSPKGFVHRIGRTGRAGASGKAISFVAPEDRQHFRVIQKKQGKKITLIESKDIDLGGL